MSDSSKRYALGGLTMLVLVGLGMALGAWLGGRSLNPLGDRKIDEKVTLSVLRSEALAFLVTRRTVTQVVVEHEESDLLGDWHGVLWATVTWHWGVDLTKLAEKDIRQAEGRAYVRLPEPELLNFSVDFENVGYMDKSTAVPKLLDIARGGEHRRMLEKRLKARTTDFAKGHNLCPNREEMVRKLNDQLVLLRRAAGMEIVFE